MTDIDGDSFDYEIRVLTLYERPKDFPELESAVGPRVVVTGLPAHADQHHADLGTETIESEIPEGYEIAWGNEVELSPGTYSYPLVRS